MVEQYFARVVLETAPGADIWACFSTADSIVNSLFVSELGRMKTPTFDGSSSGPTQKNFERPSLDALRGVFADHHTMATSLDTHKFPRKGNKRAITLVAVTARFNKYTKTVEMEVGSMGYDRLRIEKFMNDAILRLNGDSSIPRPEGAAWKLGRFNAVSSDRPIKGLRFPGVRDFLSAQWTVQVGGGLAVLAIAGGFTWIIATLFS